MSRSPDQISLLPDSESATRATPFPQTREQGLRQRMRRCSEEAVAAAIKFQETGDAALVRPIVLGVLARFIEPDARPRLSGGEDTRLIEDLGVDSLLMVEVVLLLEDIFEVTIPNEDLRGMSTLSDVHEVCARYAESFVPERKPVCASDA